MLRTGGGERLRRDTVDLERHYWPERSRLEAMLALPPISVKSFDCDGRVLVVRGLDLPIEGDPARNGFDVDGEAFDALVHPIEVPEYGERLWYSPRASQIAFEGRIALRRLRAGSRDAFRIGFRDLGGKARPARTFFIPTSLAAYAGVPDDRRQKRILGWSNAAKFITTGLTHHRALKRIAARHSPGGWARYRSILDWGCGCGRIARHLLREAPPGARVIGFDVDAENLAWCDRNLRGGCFVHGPIRPPLPLPEGACDLVIGNSVMTHLDEADQFAWLAELRRVTTPGAILLLTVHAETAVAWAAMNADWIDRWQARGIDAEGRNADLDGVVSDREYYRNTYHTSEYVRREWTRGFEILAIERAVVAYQDVVVLRRLAD